MSVMSDLSLRVGTLALLAALVFASMPVDASHTTPYLQISDQPTTIVNGAPGQTLQFKVTNDGHTEMTSIVVSVNDIADEFLTITEASAPQWTRGALVDSDSPANGADKVSFTPTAPVTGLAVGSSLVITLTVTADEKVVASPAHQTAVTVTAQDAGATSFPNSFKLTYVNPTIALSKTAVTVAEPAGTDTVGVSLSHKPSGSVTLDVVASGSVTVTPATLTFTTTNFATAQTITIKAVDDATDTTQNRAGSVTVSSQSSTTVEAYKAAASSVTAEVIDDEGVGFTLSASALSLSEKTPTPGTFTVVLTQAPTADVTLGLTVSTTGTATAADVTLIPATQVVFTPSNWNAAQTVSVTPVDDKFVEGEETLVLIVAPVPATTAVEYDTVPAQTVTATIADDDAFGLAVTQTGGSTEVNEEGATTDTFTVKLSNAPTSKVVIDVTGTEGQATLSPTNAGDTSASRLTFTNANWNTAQTVTIKAIDDTERDGDAHLKLALDVVDGLSDDTWDAMETVTLDVIVHDNEKSVMARPSSLEITEGEAETYEVSLTVAPSASVEVAIEVPEGLTITPKKLTFTASDFDTPQSVAVEAMEDGEKQGDRDVTITHKLTTDDGGYADGAPQSVAVTIIDDELVDLSVINRNLQASVEVERKSGDNIITWDAPDDVAGVQIWHTGSPFSVLASADNDTIEFVRGEYKDTTGEEGAFYIVTAYVAKTLEGGFYGPSDSLSMVAGYQGTSEEDQEALAAEIPEEDEDTALIIGLVIAVLVIIVIVVILVLVNRKKEDDWDDLDDGADDPHTQHWHESGWNVEPEPKAPLGPSGEDDWVEGDWEPASQDTPGGPAWDAWEPEASQGSPSAGEPAHEPRAHDTWAPADEEPRAHGAPPRPGRDDESVKERPWKESGWSVEDAWSDETPEETFHLNCPRCHTDFNATGHRPLHTTCPNCGVRGTLR